MNIHKLTLAGFGSYLEPQTIEFGKFGCNSLFLITGPTGGGKTTILNAITYALYGFKNDGDQNVRTAHADPEHATFVEMEFEVSGKTYRIKRSPAYLGLSKKSKGRTAQQAPNLEFYELITKDGKVVESNLAKQKITETQELINEKVGRNFKQFMMTSMMRQNGFVELLNSSSKDRTEIFRTLFNTADYSKVEDSFKAAFDKAKAEYDKTRENVVKEFNKIKVTANLELNEKLDEYRKVAYENKIGETTALLESIIAYDQEEATRAAEALQENSRQIGELQVIANNKLKVEDIENRIPCLQESLVVLKEELANCLEQQRQAQLSYDKEYGPMIAKKTELKAKVEVFAEIRMCQKAAEASAMAVAKASAEVQVLEAGIGSNEARLQDISQFLEAKKDVPVHKAKLTSAKESTEAVAKDIDKKSGEILELDETAEHIAKAISDLKCKISTAELNLTDCAKAVEQARDAETNYQSLLLEIQKLQNENNAVQLLLQSIGSYEAEEKVLLNLHQQYESAKNKLQKQATAVTTMEEALLRKQGFAIASKLKEGDICPVCGNHYVPGKVKFASGNVTEAALSLARKQKEKLEQEERLAYDTLNDRNSRHNSKAEEIKARGKEILGEETLENIKKQAEAKHKDQVMKLQKLNIQATTLQKQATSLNKLQLAEDKAKTDLQKLTENCNMLTKKLYANESLSKNCALELKQAMIAYRATDNTVAERLAIVVSLIGDKIQDIAKSGQDFADILKEYVNSFCNAIRECDAQLIEMAKAQKEQAMLVKELDKLKKELSTKNMYIVREQTAEQNAKSQQQSLQLKVQGVSEQNLSTAIADLDTQAKALKDTLAATTKEAEELHKQLSDKEKLLTGLEQQLKALTDDGKVDFSSVSANLADLKAQQPTLQQESELYTAELNSNKAVLAETKGKGKMIAAQEKRKTILERLKKVARGEVSKYKIPLETHVQGYYMDKVVEEARSFLRNVSGSRYELIRRKSDNNSGKTGLDLNVIDIHNGCSERSVSSLSGGESFSGALALLIALSNVVQSFNGGAENNIIFVDEGFGSLDERFLNRVITAQSALSNNNRSIGIISHRPELEENIFLKLTVKSEEVGGLLTSKIGYEGV